MTDERPPVEVVHFRVVRARRQQLPQRLDRALEVPGRLLLADGFEGIDLRCSREREADEQRRPRARSGAEFEAKSIE